MRGLALAVLLQLLRRLQGRGLRRLQVANAAAAQIAGQATPIGGEVRVLAARAGGKALAQQLGQLPFAMGLLHRFIALFRGLRQPRQQVHLCAPSQNPEARTVSAAGEHA